MKLKLYDIRLCRKTEWEKLKNFIELHWKHNHILSISKQLFEFQHGKGENGNYNFVVAVHKESQSFHAVLGFISSSTYDLSSMEHPQAIYGALWKVREDVENMEVRKLGLGVLYFLLKLFPQVPYITLGLSEDSRNVYVPLRFDFGRMNHYYFANSKIKDFKIAYKPENFEVKTTYGISICELTEVPVIQNDFYPIKNRNYIINRYLNHPLYKYKLLGIYKENTLLSIWVYRVEEVDGALCLRIVDMIGTKKRIGDVSHPLAILLRKYNAEYIDCYNYGINNEYFYELGFKDVSGETIIPNYFEPYLRENIDIHYAVYSNVPVIIFKADGDQDRPSKL